jgi:hypothetical protein
MKERIRKMKLLPYAVLCCRQTAGAKKTSAVIGGNKNRIVSITGTGKQIIYTSNQNKQWNHAGTYSKGQQ